MMRGTMSLKYQYFSTVTGTRTCSVFTF